MTNFQFCYLTMLSCAFLLNAQILWCQNDSSPEPSSGEANHEPAAEAESEARPFVPRPIPHPYVLIGPSLTGGAYRPVALRAEAGLELETRYGFANAIAAYDNDRMTHDGNQPNPKGHDRYLDGSLYFLIPGQLFAGNCFVGAGWRWNELSTTNYTEASNRAQFGGAYDFIHRSCSDCERNSFMRVTMNWVAAGDDWRNGTHGAEIRFFFLARAQSAICSGNNVQVSIDLTRQSLSLRTSH